MGTTDATDATDPYTDGSEETRQEFTANDFRITRALDSLLVSAKSIKGDGVSAEDIAARVHTLRPLLNRWDTTCERHHHTTSAGPRSGNASRRGPQELHVSTH